MTKDWHRSEPRDVRPFFATAKAENSLHDSGIRLFPSEDVSQETSFEIGDGDLSKLTPVIYPALLNPQVWMPEGLAAGDLELVLVGRQPLLKRSEVVARYALSQPIPEELEIAPDTLASLGGGRNTQFTLALTLAADRPPQPGSPFVVGHWLARKTFSIRSRSNRSLFDVRTRTDEEWIAAEFPAKTLYAVQYQGGIESPLEDGGASVAIVYVHADAHHKMMDSKLGDALQPLLSSEILMSIISASRADWEKLTEPPKGSPIETLHKQLVKGGDLPFIEMISLAKTAPEKLKAIIQSRMQVVQNLK